jgi:hypothetical protein
MTLDVHAKSYAQYTVSFEDSDKDWNRRTLYDGDNKEFYACLVGSCRANSNLVA